MNIRRLKSRGALGMNYEAREVIWRGWRGQTRGDKIKRVEQASDQSERGKGQAMQGRARGKRSEGKRILRWDEATRS